MLSQGAHTHTQETMYIHALECISHDRSCGNVLFYQTIDIILKYTMASGHSAQVGNWNCVALDLVILSTLLQHLF